MVLKQWSSLPQRKTGKKTEHSTVKTRHSTHDCENNYRKIWKEVSLTQAHHGTIGRTKPEQVQESLK